LSWEKNYTDPSPHHIPLICNFLKYCPLIENPVEHFGHQLGNYRVFTSGKSIFDLATEIEIDEGTLNEIEQSNVILTLMYLTLSISFYRQLIGKFQILQYRTFTPRELSVKGLLSFMLQLVFRRLWVSILLLNESS